MTPLHIPCPESADRLGDLCQSCQQRALECLQEEADRFTLIKIDGEPYRIAETMEVRDLGGRWVTVVCIESKRTTPLKQPLTEAEAG
jgi:hypothetical protein